MGMWAALHFLIAECGVGLGKDVGKECAVLFHEAPSVDAGSGNRSKSSTKYQVDKVLCFGVQIVVRAIARLRSKALDRLSVRGA